MTDNCKPPLLFPLASLFPFRFQQHENALSRPAINRLPDPRIRVAVDRKANAPGHLSSRTENIERI
jgi:hypothetical protein